MLRRTPSTWRLEGDEVADARRLVGQQRGRPRTNGDRLAVPRLRRRPPARARGPSSTRSRDGEPSGSRYAASSSTTAPTVARRGGACASFMAGGLGGVGDALVRDVRGQAAVDDDLGAVVVGRVVGDQEDDRRRDVGGHADPAERDLGQRRLEERRRGRLHQRRVDQAGHHRVDPDAPVARARARPCGSARAAPTCEAVYAAAAWPAIAATEQMLTIEEPGRHQRHQRLDAEHRAGDVDVEGLLPGLERRRAAAARGRRRRRC